MIQILYNIFILPIYKVIEILFKLSYDTMDSVLLAIFIVSFFVNLICLPMYMKAEKLSEEEHALQKEMEPEIKKIKKNFRGDEKFMLLKTCYRQHNYHPIMALRTSLSLLIQIPFFMAAYLYFNNCNILPTSIFINNKTLSVPDGMLEVFGFSINLLPILMTVINLISAQIYSKDKQAKYKIQMYSFAIFFLVLLYNSPAGLVIYWTFNNLFSLFKNIGLKQKNPSAFLKHACMITAFLLFCKITYHNLATHYAPDSTTLFYILAIYSVISLISVVLKKEIKLSFNIRFDSDFKMFLLSVTTLAIITGLLIPTIIFSSSMDFIEALNTDLWEIMIKIFSQSIGFYIFAPLVLYCFLNKNIQAIFTIIFPFLAIFYGISLCLYNGELGILSTDLTFKMPEYSVFKIVLDIAIIILLIFIFYLCFRKNKKKYIKNTLVCILFTSIAFSTFNIYTFYKNITTYNSNVETTDINIKPIKISKNGKNVIVIFVDRTIGVYAKEIFENDTKLRNKFSGFILYPNTVSYYGQSSVAYPPMIAGYEYTPENMEKRTTETYEQKTNEAYLVLPKIFINNGYSSLIVDPHSYFDDKDLTAYNNTGINLFSFSNSTEQFDFPLNERERKVLFQLKSTTDLNMVENKCFNFSNYLILPSFLKIQQYKKTIDEEAPVWDERLVTAYKKLIALPHLTEIEESTKNQFIIFNNEANHINKYDKSYHQEHKYMETEVLYAIANFIDYLKENNVFDNTRIVVVSDHGHFDQVSKYLGTTYLRYNPLLMQKDFRQNDELSINDDFMTNADMPILATNEIISNPINPYTGKLLTESVDKTNVKILSGRIGPEIQNANKYTPRLRGYGYHQVKENIFKEKNWIIEDEFHSAHKK